MNVVIIDYGAGNVASVTNALSRLGITPNLSNDPKIIQTADKIIFPGVGEAKHAMDNLIQLNLVEVIKNLKQPVLGICVGMQLLCESSEESNTKAIGIFGEDVKLFRTPPKVPHMGWNKVNFEEDSIFYELNDRYFYFVHSYYAPYGYDTVGFCNYFGEFSAVLQKKNFYACQFHPEKSAEAGERFLKLFLDI